MLQLRWSQTRMIIQAVHEIISESKLARIVVRQLLQNPKMGSSDRKLVAAAIYDIVKNHRLYSWLATTVDQPAAAPEVLGVYLALNDYSSADTEVPVFARKVLEARINESESSPELRYSMPDWIAAKWNEPVRNEILKILCEKAPVFIRVNTLKSNEEEVTAVLRQEDVRFEKVMPGCYRIDSNMNLLQHKLHKSGMIEIQDEGSQQVGIFSGVIPGSMVIDACAGAGGKTLQLAVLMQNKGRILALDVHKSALDELRLRKQRNNANIIDVHHYKEIKLHDYNSLADTVLCDVPCSGSGTFRREVDRKWKLTPLELDHLCQTQAGILERSWPLVKPGGQLIYATCSLFEEENQQQITSFLALRPEALLAEDRLILPQSGGGDGFYMARLSK